MDWFENITGFREAGYEETQRLLEVSGGFLRCKRSGNLWSVGSLETPTLADLRKRTAHLLAVDSPTSVCCMVADARELHRRAVSAGALFQVASQFNLLEMSSYEVTPEQGVTRYEEDRTQGPACAIAAGAATIYRNYCVPVGDARGQTEHLQLDCLADIGCALGNTSSRLWRMRNGYALFTENGLHAIDEYLAALDEPGIDALRARLRIGLHWQVDVTDVSNPGLRVSQAFCSALPIVYQSLPSHLWHRFAILVLEAAYEATLLAAVLNRAAHGSPLVFLTSVGGGAFGNSSAWIHAAMRRGLDKVRDAGLQVHLVSRSEVPEAFRSLCETYSDPPDRGVR